MNEPYLSIIITAKDKKDSKLKELLSSINAQDYPKKKLQIIVETKGDSESAKAIALKKAKGEIVAIMASDNYLVHRDFLKFMVYPLALDYTVVGSYPSRYYYRPDDDLLNRYFALMGVNDVIPYYLNKNDRLPYYMFDNPFEFGRVVVGDIKKVTTLGDNGFFIRKKILQKADLKNYFHIDVCQDLFDLGYKRYAVVDVPIWHRTGGNIFKFFKKRLKYGEKFMVKERRWKMITKEDIPRLALFIFFTLTLVQPIYVSLKGYRKIHDKAWFMHLPFCWGTLITYTLMVVRRCFR